MDEKKFIENIQKYPLKTGMVLLSLPFEPMIFPFIIFILKGMLNLKKDTILVLLVSHFFVLLMKIKYNRKRPYQKLPKHIKNKYIFQPKDRSLPSGHSYTSYVLAWLISKKLTGSIF